MHRFILPQRKRGSLGNDNDHDSVPLGGGVDVERNVAAPEFFSERTTCIESPPTTVGRLDEEGANDTTGTSWSTAEEEESKAVSQSCLTAICILLLGFAASAAFLGLSISTLKDAEHANFDRFANDMHDKLRAALVDYSFAANMIHARCRNRNFTRQDFRDLYEYVVADDLFVQAIDFKPRVLRDERTTYENEAREYFSNRQPQRNYTGFTGFNYDNSTTVESRIESDVYYPVHYFEPLLGNERAAGFDFYASGSRRRAIDESLRTGKPSISDRLKLIQETVAEAYGVVLLHPGVNISSQSDSWPRDLASIVIRIPDLLKRSTKFQLVGADVYLFDKLDISDESLTFLGAISVMSRSTSDDTEANITLLPGIAFTELPKNTWRKDISASNKIWSLAIVPNDNTFVPKYFFVIMGGIVITLASMFLAFNVHSKTHRMIRYNAMKRHSEMDKAALILDSAKKSAQSERELNDFIAHEVRNPVAAAMAACSFVKRTTSKDRSELDDESWNVVRGDVHVISNALHFINDLLRSMLDMHRATSQQLVVNLVPVDILHDVLEPVQSILYVRGSAVRLEVECDSGLYATADPLRLKQVILNLGRNSTKFVDEGFIRFTAKKLIDDDSVVEFAVEDSGPGIPLEKREKMFTKYQDSLDGLAQGTGIGLYLCKKLVSLMGGKLSLDTNYDSGLQGCRGARVTFCLKASTASVPNGDENNTGHVGHLNPFLRSPGDEYVPELPEGLSVLFVDDDSILRKLFGRVIKVAAPTWNIREASNGETALQLTDTESFDLIFMDMYMASVEKQLLGTEAVAALRAKGVTSRICGLSANDKETEFMEAGANAFLVKPFPCEKEQLTRELLRILSSKDDNTH